jgi:LAO/AO transport system kinase
VTADDSLLSPLIQGDRRALAKAITLVESRLPDHRARAQALLAGALPHTGKALRIGLSGPPGAGKSTFIEAFGLFLLNKGLKVAVLAIDPSSARSGGSILGDKTRMEQLSADPRAFIRPSPSGGSLGGVARRTREAMLLTEAAGYDVVLVETVGVGQSETAVADMVDLFALLLPPGAGDELQGIKRGIMELADLVVVTKADGDLEAAAKRAQGAYRAGLHLMRPRYAVWTPHVLLCSAITGKGLGDIWKQMTSFQSALSDSGDLAALRARQAKAWLWSEIRDRLEDIFRNHPGVSAKLQGLEAAVIAGTLPPAVAAQTLFAAFEG